MRGSRARTGRGGDEVKGDGAESLYAVLGVEPGATAEAIRAAYRSRARALHPDVNPGPTAAADFSRLQRAYEVLADPAQRARYDRAEVGAPDEPSGGGGAGGMGVGHVTWTNVAGRGGAAHRGAGSRAKGKGRGAAGADPGDPTGFEELYRAFIQTRLDDAARAGKGEGGGARAGE